MPPRNKTRNLIAIRSTRSKKTFKELTAKFKSRPNVIAEGDSWFAYPPEWLLAGKRSNIISHLKHMKNFNLLQLDSNGDEAVDILSGNSKFKLLDLINENHIHYLLFSGGGNDIVGKYDFDFFLIHKNDVRNGANWRDYVHSVRSNRRLNQIKNAYADLIDFCSEYSKNKNIKIVTHTYDYMKPDPQGAVFIGGLLKIDNGKSWLYPYLKAKKVPDKFHQPIVTHLIDRLAKILLDLQDNNKKRFFVADTRGTIDPAAKWLNEIHPTPSQFKEIAIKVFTQMK